MSPRRFPFSAQARQFCSGFFIAFLPAAVIGAALHGFIKEVLFEARRSFASC